MQRVEIPAITLVSQTQVEEIQKLKEAESGVKEAADLIRSNDADGAIAKLQGLLATNPKDPNALFLIGMAYAKKSMLAEAQAAFLQVTELAPKFAAAFYQLGRRRTRPGPAREGPRSLQKDQRARPRQRGRPLQLRPDPVQAESHRRGPGRVRKGHDPEARRPGLSRDGGALLHQQGRLRQGRRVLEKAKTGYNDPDRTKFLDNLIEQLKLQIKK